MGLLMMLPAAAIDSQDDPILWFITANRERERAVRERERCRCGLITLDMHRYTGNQVSMFWMGYGVGLHYDYLD